MMSRIDWIKIAAFLFVALAWPVMIAIDAPPAGRSSAGWFLIVIGGMNVIGYRSIAKQLLRVSWPRRKPGKFFQRLGLTGIARLYSALGIIFFCGGVLLLSLSVLGS